MVAVIELCCFKIEFYEVMIRVINVIREIEQKMKVIQYGYK